jgi:hypothetical protein
MTYIYIYFIVSTIITLGTAWSLIRHFGSLDYIAEQIKLLSESEKVTEASTNSIIRASSIIGFLFSPFIVVALLMFGGFRE